MKIQTFMIGELLTNTYFLTGENGECIVIDPGLEGEKIYEKLQDKGLCPAYILLTHGHFDHARGVRVLQEKTGAKVACHRLDAPLLSDPERNVAATYYRGRGEEYPCARADLFLEDGDEITLGSLSLRVLHTPGHTPGSVSYLAEEALFSGDTLFADGVGRTDFPGGNNALLISSLNRLLTVNGDRRLLPGHGNSSTLEKAKLRIPQYLTMLKRQA